MKRVLSLRTREASATELCSTTCTQATASAAKVSQLCCMTVLSVHPRYGSRLCVTRSDLGIGSKALTRLDATLILVLISYIG